LGINAASFIVIAITSIFCFNNFKVSLKNYLLPFSLFILIIVISYFFADFKYNIRNEMFLLFSACGIYLLNGFLIVEERKKVLIIQIVIALWLTIYIFASIFFSPNYSYISGLAGYEESCSSFYNDGRWFILFS
jgi:Ca2+/Na+ antiporter